MVTIQLKNPAISCMPLGATCTFEITAPPAVSWRACVCFQNVIYPKPLASAEAGAADANRTTVKYFPESPGDYELQVVWTDGRSSGIEHFEFSVTTGRAFSPSPRQIVSQNGFHIWVPTGWDGEHISRTEDPALKIISSVIRSGQVAYDIGANVGVYALEMMRRVDGNGCVYAFEFNPACLQFLIANVAAAGFHNCSILPLAIGDGESGVNACVNYGNAALGLTGLSGFFPQKIGHEFSVTCAKLDDIVGSFSLRKPDFIKIDVEGAEARVLAGMQKILAAHKPVLLIELHGFQAATAALRELDRLHYTLEDIETKRIAKTSGDFMNGMKDRSVQVLCKP